jgi:hypothetical protein
VLRPLFKFAITENLQVNEPDTDDSAPEKKNAAKKIESKVGVIAGCACGHRISSDRFGWRNASALR